MTTFRKQYTDIRNRRANIALEAGAINSEEQLIVLFRLGNRLEAFYKDAQKVSHTAYTEMDYRLDADGDRIPYTFITSTDITQELYKAGYKITVVSESRH